MRPTKNVYVSSVEPAAFATALVRLELAAFRSIASDLGRKLAPPVRSTAPIELSAAKVAAFARDGDRGRLSPEQMAERVVDLDARLVKLGHVKRPGGYVADSIGAVMLAALGRVALDSRASITTAQLAAVLGVSMKRVQQMIRLGQLRRVPRGDRPGREMDSPIVWADARQLVRSRGVPGLCEAEAA